MANVLLKHLLSYGSAGNAGLVVADAAALSAYGSEMVRGVCTDWSGNVYLTDEAKHIIVKVTEGGQVSLFAGIANTSGLTNGARGVAKFNAPTGITCDRSGNLYVADTGNNQIRKLDPNGNTCLLAGDDAGASGRANGANVTVATFNAPMDVTVDCSGNVYVADTGNNNIRMINATTTYGVAGDLGGAAGDVLGQGLVARFDHPMGISCDRSGKMFVSDTGNKKIKAIRNDYTVFGIVGPTFRTGDNFHVLEYIEVDNSGFIYVVDYNDATDLSRLIKMGQDGQESTMEIIVEPDVTKIGIAVSPNQTLYVTQSEAELESWSSSSSSVSSSVSSISSPSSSSVSSVSSVSR